MATVTPDKTEIFQLAATLAGCQTVDLVDVSVTASEITIGLATGQQFTFSLDSIAGQLTDDLRALIGLQLDAPAPASATALTDSPSAKTRKAKGA